jgi:hypothetical protein
MADVTQILNAIGQGEPHAAKQLLPLVYDELRRLAAQKVRDQLSDTNAAAQEVAEVCAKKLGSKGGRQRPPLI